MYYPTGRCIYPVKTRTWAVFLFTFCYTTVVAEIVDPLHNVPIPSANGALGSGKSAHFDWSFNMSILNAITTSSAAASIGHFAQICAEKVGPCPKVCNGVQAPQRAGKCANVWIAVVDHLVAHHQMPSVSQVLAALPGENSNNVKIEYYRAVKFIQGLPRYWKEIEHGVEAEPEATPETETKSKRRTA